MQTRALLIAIVVLLAFVPIVGAQQDDELTGEELASAFGQGTCADGVVYRDYHASDLGVKSLFSGQPVFLAFVALDYPSDDEAKDAMTIFRQRFGDPDWLFSSEDEALSPQPVSLGTLGDQAYGFVVDIQSLQDNDDADVTWTLVYTAIRQGPIIVLAMGLGLVGSVGIIADTVERTLDRWPTSHTGSFSNTHTNGDGQRVGGLWEAIPRIDDMPAGYRSAWDGLTFPQDEDCPP